jgi:hypothetical protein
MESGSISGPNRSLCHTFWAVVFLREDWSMQYGYPLNLWSCRVIFCNFRVRTKVKYGGDTERP